MSYNPLGKGQVAYIDRMAYEDPYVVLGVNKGASKQDVQKAFRELALKHHPDRDPSLESAQKFQRISRAATTILKEVFPL